MYKEMNSVANGDKRGKDYVSKEGRNIYTRHENSIPSTIALPKYFGQLMDLTHLTSSLQIYSPSPHSIVLHLQNPYSSPQLLTRITLQIMFDLLHNEKGTGKLVLHSPYIRFAKIILDDGNQGILFSWLEILKLFLILPNHMFELEEYSRMQRVIGNVYLSNINEQNVENVEAKLTILLYLQRLLEYSPKVREMVERNIRTNPQIMRQNRFLFYLYRYKYHDDEYIYRLKVELSRIGENLPSFSIIGKHKIFYFWEYYFDKVYISNLDGNQHTYISLSSIINAEHLVNLTQYDILTCRKLNLITKHINYLLAHPEIFPNFNKKPLDSSTSDLSFKKILKSKATLNLGRFKKELTNFISEYENFWEAELSCYWETELEKEVIKLQLKKCKTLEECARISNKVIICALEPYENTEKINKETDSENLENLEKKCINKELSRNILCSEKNRAEIYKNERMSEQEHSTETSTPPERVNIVKSKIFSGFWSNFTDKLNNLLENLDYSVQYFVLKIVEMLLIKKRSGIIKKRENSAYIKNKYKPKNDKRREKYDYDKIPKELITGSSVPLTRSKLRKLHNDQMEAEKVEKEEKEEKEENQIFEKILTKVMENDCSENEIGDLNNDDDDYFLSLSQPSDSEYYANNSEQRKNNTISNHTNTNNILNNNKNTLNKHNYKEGRHRENYLSPIRDLELITMEDLDLEPIIQRTNSPQIPKTQIDIPGDTLHPVEIIDLDDQEKEMDDILRSNKYFGQARLGYNDNYNYYSYKYNKYNMPSVISNLKSLNNGTVIKDHNQNSHMTTTRQMRSLAGLSNPTFCNINGNNLSTKVNGDNSGANSTESIPNKLQQIEIINLD